MKKNPITIIFFIATFLFSCTQSAQAQWPGQTPPNEVPVYLPENYTSETSFPLLIFLHGWAPISTVWYDILVPIQDDANDYGYIYAKPNGSQDSLGDYYWNATDACCDIFNNTPDHVGYILAVIESIKNKYNVDPKRIHLIGQSNGGFMCHRMACESPETFASIVSLNGAMWEDSSYCQPTEPIHVLHIHGTLDPIILWPGGLLGPELVPYPSATTTIEFWANHNGCSLKPVNTGSFNFDDFIWLPDAETTRWEYQQCEEKTEGSAELWEVLLGSHFPIISNTGIEEIFNYLDTHIKPDTNNCPPDTNNDQQINVTDLLFVISSYGTNNESADVNNDGIVNVIDILEIVSSLGDSC